MRRALLSWTIVSLILSATALLAAEPSPTASPSRFEYFITRQGNQLRDGQRPFRFVGANMPGLVLPYDFTLRLPERLVIPTAWEQEDAFRTLDQMNLRVVRLWNLAIRGPKEGEPGKPTWHPVQGPGQFNEASFQAIDQVLALANRYGVRVIFDFTAEAGDYLGGIGTYAAWHDKPRKAFWTDPQVKEDYQATLRYVVNRVNTVTGVAYRDDKAILAWQFGNEMYSTPSAWAAEMAAFLKQIDPNHLVADTRHLPTKGFVLDPNIDLYTRHYYSDYLADGRDWIELFRQEVAELKGERPLFIGEFGPYIDGRIFTRENVVPKLQAFLDFVQKEEGIAGTMLWSMYFHHRDGGFYWHQIFTYPAVWSYHWPGFASADAQQEREILASLRRAAFALEGKPEPPLPVPGPPELLPIGDTPLMSWRGSAGASGYDLQRAAEPSGPWTTIAQNVSDADVAYRPLYSDTSVAAGQTWHYRVLARNSSGLSEPSNVVGPVQVRQVCLADELQSLDLAEAHSPGLKLSNDYNARYAEYLFRVQGNQDDWIGYRVPSEIRTVHVWAWRTDEASTLAIQVSADGQTWTDLPATPHERSFKAPPTGRKESGRTLLDYEISVSTPATQVRLVWRGAVELDRVEIYHSGVPTSSPSSTK